MVLTIGTMSRNVDKREDLRHSVECSCINKGALLAFLIQDGNVLLADLANVMKEGRDANPLVFTLGKLQNFSSNKE